jgi:ribosome biogenesis protein MAK21
MAFIKRISTSSIQTAPQVTAGLLFIISEVFQHRPELKKLVDVKYNEKPFYDNPKKNIHRKQEKEDENDDEENVDDNASVHTTTTENNEFNLLGNFDASKRNPSFACKDDTIPFIFESCLLNHHYHPSVRNFANSLFQSPSHHIEYSGDPLNEFTIMAFLNRFAYKNPKQQMIDKLKAQQKEVSDYQPVNQEFEELIRSSEDPKSLSKYVAPDKKFFYKFFADRELLRAQGKTKENRRKKKGDEDEDDEDMDEEAEGSDLEREIDEYTDQLAEDMMKHDALTRGEDLGDDFDDDEDFGNEEENEGDDFDDEEEEEMPIKKKKGGKQKKVEFDSDVLDFEAFKEQQESKSKNNKKKNKYHDDNDDDDIMEPEVYHDEMEDEMMFDEEDEDEEKPPQKKGKKDQKDKKNKKRKQDDDEDDEDFGDLSTAFADADAYEQQMEENVNQYQFDPTNKPNAKILEKNQGKQHRKRQRTNKNRK